MGADSENGVRRRCQSGAAKDKIGMEGRGR